MLAKVPSLSNSSGLVWNDAAQCDEVALWLRKNLQ
jgi:hypothetical protein